MRFLFVSPLYYPHIGGVEDVVESVAERLVAMGHEVVVLAGEPGVNAPFGEVIGGFVLLDGLRGRLVSLIMCQGFGRGLRGG